VAVPVDHVRSPDELSAAVSQRCERLVDVRHLEVEDRVTGVSLGLAAEEEPRTTAVEEGEVAELVEEGQAGDVSVPCDCGVGIAYVAGDLADAAELEF